MKRRGRREENNSVNRRGQRSNAWRVVEPEALEGSKLEIIAQVFLVIRCASCSTHFYSIELENDQ